MAKIIRLGSRRSFIVRAHAHVAIGKPVGGLDYTGACATLAGANAEDRCEMCWCGATRYVPYVDGIRERDGKWEEWCVSPELIDDPADWWRTLLQDHCGGFASA